jgi:drug/metabolite transporter (DMT)-like permease
VVAPLTRGRAAAVILVASAAFSTSAPFARLARPAHPMLVAFGRVAIAALVLSLIDPRGLFATVRRLSPRDRARVLFAGVLLAGHFGLFQWGLEATSLPAAVALVSLEPLAVVLTAWGVFGIRPKPLERAGVLVATAGAIVVSRSAGHGEHRLLGDALVLGAVVLFGFYVAFARGLRDALPARHYAPLVFAAAALGLGLVLPFVLASEGAVVWPVSARSAAMIALVGLVPTAVGHTSVQIAARTLSPSVVALVCPAETLGSMLLGLLLLGGAPTWTEAVGAAIILAGAGLAVAAQR